MAQAEQIFNDLGVDAITAVELFGHLGIAMDELNVPQRFHKLLTVVDYLKQFPTDTQRFLIRKACYGKQVDKLDHMFEYTNLLKHKSSVEGMVKNTEDELSAVASDPLRNAEIGAKKMILESELHKIKEEVAIYEK